MTTDPKQKAGRAKVERHRSTLRRQGLRPIQIWVPDTRLPGFREEARRQSGMVARGPQAAEDQAFVDAISDDELHRNDA